MRRAQIALLLCCVFFAQQLFPTSVAAQRPLNLDPKLLHVAPEECLVFIHSTGFTAADPNSENKTEQLLSDPEVQEFFDEVKRVASAAMDKAMEDVPTDEERQQIVMFQSIAQALMWRPFTFYTSKIDLSDVKNPRFEAAILMDVGPHLKEAQQIVSMLKEEAGDNAKQIEIEGVKCVEVREQDAPPIHFVLHDTMLIFAAGEGAMAGALSRGNGKPPEWMAKMAERLPVERPAIASYVNLQQIKPLLEAVPEDEDRAQGLKFWKESGLEELEYACGIVGFEGSGMLTRGLLAAREFRGIFSCLNAGGLDENSLRSIPMTTAGAVAMQVDAATVFDSITELAIKMEPEAAAQINQFRQRMEELLQGMDIRDDLLAALGDRWLFYQTGGWATMMVPDMVFALELKDAAVATKAMEAIVAVAQEEMAEQGFVSLKEKKFGEASGYSVRGMPIAVGFSIHDGELLVGLSPAAIKNHLKNKAAGGESLAMQPEVAAMLKRYERPNSIVFSDVAKSLEISYPSLQMMLNMVSGPLSQQGIEIDPSVLPTVSTLKKYLEPSVYATARVEDGMEFEAREVLPRMSGSAGAAGVGVALLLPAVNAARAAARRAQSTNNMRQLALGALNFESANRTFPSNKKGLSWRVHILPYVEEQALYDQFDLNQPWDSEHNKKLIEKMPAIYASPTSVAPVGRTVYQAVEDERAVILDGDQGLKIGKVKDGLSKTILFLEVNDERAVEWTKPDDFDFDEENPSDGLGEQHPGDSVLSVFCDGAAHTLGKDLGKDVWRKLFLRDDGEVVDYAEFAPQ